MKKLLSFAAVGLLTGALLDPVIYSGLDKPIPWVRDVLMFAAGVVCMYVLVKYRKDL